MDENRDRYGVRGNPSSAPRGNRNGNGFGLGNGGRGYNGRAPPSLGFDGGESSVSGRGTNDERYGSRPPNTPMTPYTPYTPVTMGYDGGESSISAGTPRQDRYYGGESAIGGRPAVTPATAGYHGGESSFNAGAPQTGRYDGRESYLEGRAPRTGRYDPAESTVSAGTPRTARFDPGMGSSIAHPDTPRTAHYDTTATTMSMDPSRTGSYDKDNTIAVAEYYDPERAREHERQVMERERVEREQGIHRPAGMQYGPPPPENYLSTSGSSTSSYLDISRNFPSKNWSFQSFFTTPSEKSDTKKRTKRKTKKLTKHNTSSSSSLNEDLAFGTGFLRYRRKRNVRSRDGRDRQWETVGYKSSKESLRDSRSATTERPSSARRTATNAGILAVGVGLAKLAKDHTKKDVKNGKHGHNFAETSVSSIRGVDHGTQSSKVVPHETDLNDEEGWESASDDESDSSVDTGLAFGGGSHVGKKQAAKSRSDFFGRRRTYGPKSQKSSVVDPRLLGPENSLNGYLSDRAMGFEDVQWDSSSDFGQHTYIRYEHTDRHVTDVYAYERQKVTRTHSVGSSSQASLQQVFPVPTSDPSRFDVARASSSEYNTPRPAPVPIQQPQPITMVSQSVYHQPNYVRSESGGILKSSSGKSKSFTGAALATVAGVAIGAALASSRRDERENSRSDDGKDHRSYSESAVSRRDDDRRERRRDGDIRDNRWVTESAVSQQSDDRTERRRDEDQHSNAERSIQKSRDDDRKETRDFEKSPVTDSSLTWDEKRERRREERRKDESRSTTSNSDRVKHREKVLDDLKILDALETAASERERRRRERREERRATERVEDNYVERREHVLSEISEIARSPSEPFQYQVAESPPREESSSRPKEESVPSVVTVEREPDLNEKRSLSIKETFSVSRSESRTEVFEKDERKQRHRDEVKALHDAEKIYEEAEHSTAPIEVAAIAAAAAAVATASLRQSRSSKRRSEKQSEIEDTPKDDEANKVSEKSHDDVMAEADRAYREIVMARKVAAGVRRSRTPSPERSIMNKYEEESEEEPPRIVTPPGMHERKNGPYDAPNADFKLDYIMTPKDLKVYSIPGKRYKVDQADLKGPFMTKDADARLPRPLLNLIRPTPTSTPSPEKQFASTVKSVDEKSVGFSQSDDCSNEKVRSEPVSESQPGRSSKTKDVVVEREQIKEKTVSFSRSDERSIEKSHSEPQPEPKPERYSEARDVDEKRERFSARSQDEPIHFSDRDQHREQIASNQSYDELRDRTPFHEQNQPYEPKAEPRGERRTRPTKEISPIIIGPRTDLVRSADVHVPSPTQSTIPKAVTWGPNETKHFEVESPTDHKDEFISDSSPKVLENSRYSEPRSELRSEPKQAGGWASMAAGILGAGVGAVVAGSSESSKQPEVSELPRNSKSEDEEREDRPYEYRGVVVEPETSHKESRQESPPGIIRRDSLPRDAVVELGREILAREQRRKSPPQDIRTDNLPQTPRRDSPPQEAVLELGRQILARESRRNTPPQSASREMPPQDTRQETPPSVGPKPASSQSSSHMPGSFDDDLDFAATVAAGLQDSGFNPDLVIENPEFRKRDSPPGSNDYTYKSPRAESIDDVSTIPGESSSRGFVMGEVAETPKDWSSVSPADDELFSRKEQRKLERERRQSGGEYSTPITDIIAEEPESYFFRETRKERKNRDREETRRQSLLREESSFVDISPDDHLVEEPESYIEPVNTPRKSQKPSRSSAQDEDLNSFATTLRRKSSKRSSTYDEKVESPRRESHRTYSLDDVKEGAESRIPRKPKRDSSRVDTLDPTQIPLPASENREDLELSRESRDLERTPRLDGDDPLWASSRSILSADSSTKLDDEDSPRKNRKDRNSMREDTDSARPSTTSEPTRDENEDPKKKAKDTPRKSGLFGFFSGSKTDAAKQEPAKGSRDDNDVAKKKKKKRSATTDDIIGSSTFGDLSQPGSSEPDGQKSRNEDGTQEFRKPGMLKRSKTSDAKSNSFLDNAGILGAGAGLAAGAIAVSARHQQQNAADSDDSEGTTGEREGQEEQEEQEGAEDILDPEIIEREIRPSIDPQYGDLLPLPPSGSVSPNFDPVDDLPKLPDSRPATPESEKRTVSTPREKTSRIRKSLQETPIKSPSQSAVPLKFVMGNRSNPASPIITRSTGNTLSSTLQPSPIAETAIVPRSRSRPMSWDNTKEFKPLYLLETNNRRGSFVPEELIEPLPHLPPSRTNSELDVADLPESGVLEKWDLHRPSLDPLLTNLPSDDHQGHASGESTPTAFTFKRNLAPSVEFLHDSFPSFDENPNSSSDAHSYEPPSSPDSVAEAIEAAAIASAVGLAIVSNDTSDEKESRSIQEIADKSRNNHSEYSYESHDILAEREKTFHTLSGTSSRQVMGIEEEVEPVAEFLLSKSEKGRKLVLESDNIVRKAEITPGPVQRLELISTPTKAEHVEPVEEVSTPKSKKKKKGKKGKATSLERQTDLQTGIPGQEDTHEPKSDDVSSEQQTVIRLSPDFIEEVATSIEIKPIEPLTPTSMTDENRKTDEGDPSFEPQLETEIMDSTETSRPMDDTSLIDKSFENQEEQVPEITQEVVQNPLPFVESDPVEESSVPNSKNGKKDKKKTRTASSNPEEPMVEMSIRERTAEELSERHQELTGPSSLVKPVHDINDSSIPEIHGDVAPIVDEPASPNTKKDEKKAKEAKALALDLEPEQVVIDTHHDEPVVRQPEVLPDASLEVSDDPVQETIQEPSTPANYEPTEDISIPKSRKEKKKDKKMVKKGKITDVSQEPIDTPQEQEQVPKLEEKDTTETPVVEDTPILDGFVQDSSSPCSIKSEKVKGKTAAIEEPVEKLPTASLVLKVLPEEPILMVEPSVLPMISAIARETTEPVEKGHFPAEDIVLPAIAAGVAVLGAEQLKFDKTSQDKARPDNLAAEHGDDHINLAKQLPENIDVHEQQEHSLDETEHTRVAESQIEEMSIPTETATLDGANTEFKDEQLALAEQSKDELESDSAKKNESEKEKERASPIQDDELPPYTATLDNTAQDLNEQVDVPIPQIETKEHSIDELVVEESEEIAQTSPEPLESEKHIPLKDAHVDEVISEPVHLEETPIISREIETVDNLLVDTIAPQPETIESVPAIPIALQPEFVEAAPVDPTLPQLESVETATTNSITPQPEEAEETLTDLIVPKPKSEVLKSSKKPKKQKRRDSLLESSSPEEVAMPDILEEVNPADAAEQLQLESSQVSKELMVEPEADLATFDKNHDNFTEQTPPEEIPLPEDIDEVKDEGTKPEIVEPNDVQEERPVTPLESSTANREIEFSKPPEKSHNEKEERGKQVQDTIAEYVASKDIVSSNEPTSVDDLAEQLPAPIEQVITVPARESTSNDAPMTAGLSGLMGPLTGRKKGVLEMVQALGWGRKKDKAAIATAEQGLPPRPSTARAASESSMSTMRDVSEPSMPKVINEELIKKPIPNKELKEWASLEKDLTLEKGKAISNTDPETIEPVEDVIIEETLPIESKDDVVEEIAEPLATNSTEEMQNTTSPKRERGKKLHSLQSSIFEEASKAFRARGSPIKEPENPTLTTEPASIEQSHESTSELTLDTRSEEKIEPEPEPTPKAKTKKAKRDKKKRQSLQSTVFEDPPKEDLDVSRENYIAESKPDALESEKPSAESNIAPFEILREPVLDNDETPNVSAERISTPIVERSSESQEQDREITEEEVAAPQAQFEPISEPIIEGSAEPSDISHRVVETPLEHVPAPIVERPYELPSETTREKVFTPPLPYEHVHESSEVLEEPSLPVDNAPEETTKSVEYIQPTMVDESKNLLSGDPLSETSDKNDKNLKESIIDDPPVEKNATTNEDFRNPEVVESSHRVEESSMSREPLFEQTSNDSNGIEHPLLEESTVQDEPSTVENSEPSHTVEETFLSPEPVAKVEVVEPSSSEIPIVENLKTQGESTKRRSKKSKKNRKSKDKPQSEPEASVELAREPQNTFVDETPILEKPLETAESISGEILGRPFEESMETFEPEKSEVLEPALVPLPEELPDEAIELNEPANKDILEPSLEHDEPISFTAEDIDTEIEEPKSHEQLDDSEFAALVPLPEDIIEKLNEGNEPEGREPTEAPGPVSEIMEQTTERSSDVEAPSNKDKSENLEPVSPVMEKSFEEPVPVSPKHSRKDKRKRKSAASVSLAEESLPSKSLPEIETGAVEPILENAPPIQDVPLSDPSIEAHSNEPKADKEVSEDLKPEIEQKAIEPTEAVIPSNSEITESVPRDTSVEQQEPASPKLSKKERKIRKDRLSMLLAEDNTTQAPLELQTQEVHDVPAQVTTRDPNESIPETKQTANDSVLGSTLEDVQVEQDDTPESISQGSFENKQVVESAIRDIIDSPEARSADVPAKKSKENKKEHKSVITAPTDSLVTDSRSSMPEPSQPIVEPTPKEVPRDIVPEDTVKDVVSENITPEDSAFGSRSVEEETGTFQVPVLEPEAFESHAVASEEPIIEPEHMKEEAFVPQEPATEFNGNYETSYLSREPLTEPETTDEPASASEDTIVESTISQPQTNVTQDSAFEAEVTKGNSFVPPGSVVVSHTTREEPSFKQDLDAALRVSDPGANFGERHVIEPTPREEHHSFQKPVININVTQPEQIALPESPIEPKSFEPEAFLLQEPLAGPEIVEEVPSFQERGVRSRSPSLKLSVPREFSNKRNVLEPEQIALPESPIESRPIEPEVLFPQESIAEPEIIREQSRFQEPEIDPQNRLKLSLPREESSIEQNTVEPEQIALPESPIEQEISEQEIPFEQELVSKSHIAEELILSREQSAVHGSPKVEPAEPFEHKPVEPEQIALPESPIEQKAFEHEVLFPQEPLEEFEEYPIDLTLPGFESIVPREMVAEDEIVEREVAGSHDAIEEDNNEGMPVSHLLEELPIEKMITRTQEVDVGEPNLVKKDVENATVQQDLSTEPEVFVSEGTYSATLPQEVNNDFEPVSLKTSRKDKRKNKKNLSVMETVEELTKTAAQAPSIHSPVIVPQPRLLDSLKEPTSNSPVIVSGTFEPAANVSSGDPIDSMPSTEPITQIKAMDSTLKTEPSTSKHMKPLHSEDPPIKIGLLRADTWTWPPVNWEENEAKGKDVSATKSELLDLANEVTEPQSMEDHAKEYVEEVAEEPSQELFVDALESLPIEEIAPYPFHEGVRESIGIVEPSVEEITQKPAQQPIFEAFESPREEKFIKDPIPQNVQQQMDDKVSTSKKITLDDFKETSVEELPRADLPREMFIAEHTKEEHRPAEDDVTEVLTKNSRDIKDREFGFSSPVQFTPKNTQLGAPDTIKPAPAEITLDEYKAMPIEETPKEAQQHTEDEWGLVSTKKSKKDKKKRTSTLSTPLASEVPIVATELPKDIPSNSGQPEELPPTIDNDVSHTHTSFQVPQVETIINDDSIGMSHDQQAKDIPHKTFYPQPQSSIEPKIVAVSDIRDVKSGKRLLASPLPLSHINQASEPIEKTEPISPPFFIKRIIDEPDNISSELSRMGSKNEKRKRQATINLDTPHDDRRIFWAVEVPEAEVVRANPIIEDIGRDDFYSNIASTVEEPQASEFSRPPAKKGKRNFRRGSVNIEDFRPPIGDDKPKNEPMMQRKDMPAVVATTAAIASAAFLAGKSKDPEVEPVKEEGILLADSNLEEVEKRQSIDQNVSAGDSFHDPKILEKTKDELEEVKNDGYASDGFIKEHTNVQEPERVRDAQEPLIETPMKAAAMERRETRTPTPMPTPTPTPTSCSPVLGNTQFVQEPEQMHDTQEPTMEAPSKDRLKEIQDTQTPKSLNPLPDHTEFVQEPEPMETTEEKTIDETPAETWTVDSTIVYEPESAQDPMIQIPTKSVIMDACDSRTPTPRNVAPDSDKHLEIETTSAAKHYASSSSPSPRRSPPAIEPRGDLPEEYISRPSRREIERKKKQAEVDDSKDLLPAPIQEALRNTIVPPRARSISPSPVSSPTAQRAKRARSKSRPPSRPGTPGLTMLQEESEEDHPPTLENRDSAFVSDSPMTAQESFNEKYEHMRDSAIRLRDNSPYMHVRAPVSSTDAAIESMVWPSIDEDAGTINLMQPQRPRVVESTKRHDYGIDDLPSQKNREEHQTDLRRTQEIHGAKSPRKEKHKLIRKTSLSRGELAEANHVDFVRSQRLKAFQTKPKENLAEPTQAEPMNNPETPEKQHTRHRVHRHEISDLQHRKPKEYGDLGPVKPSTSLKTDQRSVSESSPLIGGAALAAGGSGFAAARRSSQDSRPLSAQSHKSQRSASNISVTRLKSPVPLDAPLAPQFTESAKTNRSFTPPLRRTPRKISGDVRSLRQQSNIDLASEIDPASVDTATSTSSTNTANPTANEGRARAQDMADVYDGYGEGRVGSPRSPTRPHSMRRRQSMQVLELESKLDQLTAENRALAESKGHAEHMLRSNQGAPAALVERDAQIDLLKRTLASMQDEVKRLTEVNAGLTSAAVTLGQQHNARYGTLESQHAQTSRELQQSREAHHDLQSEVDGIIHNALQERDQEIASLRSQLDAAKEQIRAMQREILAAKAGDTQFLTIRDEDYFDNACQQLCQHVQQWVLRFSKFSDMRACRLTSEINNDKTIDRLDNAILDGSDVDSYLADRVRRRDVFMSMTMTMVWEFIFTRYLFGMDREQRQKLKSLEKVLSEVGPPSAVHQWRATTLTLLSKRDSFARQKEQDTLAVVHAVLETLTEILPPPSHIEGQIEDQLKRVIRAAVDLSIEMRTQRAEYMMLPPLQPEYDANGDLASKVSFNAALMNERSGDTVSNEELGAQRAVVRVVLFPLVVKKGDDLGQGDEEIVVCPAQVLVAKPRMGRGPVGRVYSPASGVDMDKKSDRSRTPASMQSSMPDTNVI